MSDQKQVSIKTEDPVPNNYEGYYIWCLTAHMPSKRHVSFASADKEAMRLMCEGTVKSCLVVRVYPNGNMSTQSTYKQLTEIKREVW